MSDQTRVGAGLVAVGGGLKRCAGVVVGVIEEQVGGDLEFALGCGVGHGVLRCCAVMWRRSALGCGGIG
jgi:hypothetical protein